MTTTTAPHATAQRAADDLGAIREQWGDLLAAIERPPAQEWPPRETRGFLTHAVDDEPPAGPVLGRVPLVIREHPAPVNLDALDAALDVERALFHTCDTIASAVQRPADASDRADPARWHLPTVRDIGRASAASAGSRAHGLHWAAVWLEGRALGEGTVAPRPSNTVHVALFAPLTPNLLDDLANVAHHARIRVERALARDGRRTHLDRPCPWCRGKLTGHTQPGGEPVVTCGTGRSCTAPALTDDRGRRAWRGADLVGLYVALDAADRRTGDSRP